MDDLNLAGSSAAVQGARVPRDAELARRVALALPNARLETIAPLPAIFLTPEIVGRAYRRFLEDGQVSDTGEDVERRAR